VPMTLDEYIVWLEGVIARMEPGANAMANAMAEYLADRVANDMLRRTVHAPGMYYKARPGAPPATASGSLAKGMFTTPASGGLRSTAYVGNSARHAHLLEYGGCVLKPTGGKVMHWVDSGGSWYHAQLPAPAHPFLQPTVQEAIDDGSLTRVAIAAFLPFDP
jgi:hypothetical protein